MSSSNIRSSLMATVNIFLLILIQSASCQQYVYRIQEERTSATSLVGSFSFPEDWINFYKSLSPEGSISNQASNDPRVYFLQCPGSKFFNLHQGKGNFNFNITTSGRIDREGMCKQSDNKLCCDTEAICEIPLQIGASPGIKNDPEIIFLKVVIEGMPFQCSQ